MTGEPSKKFNSSGKKNRKLYMEETKEINFSPDIKQKDRNDSKDSNESTSNEETQYKSKAEDFRIKYKTELCKYFELYGNCKFGNKCAYAHGINNLRVKITNTSSYRSKECNKFFENGYCPYGSRCQFAHAIKSNILNNPYDKNMSYKQLLLMLSNKDNINNIQNISHKNRLDIFTTISNNKQTCGTLFQDIKNLTKHELYYRKDD